MKKKIIVIGVITVFILGILFIFFSMKNENRNLETISGEKLLEKLNAKETFVFVVTQEGCSFCEKFKPVLNKVLKKYNLIGYELNLTSLKKEKEETQKEINKLFSTNGTPTTIFINEGIEKTTINRLVGESTESKIEKALKDRGIIK